MNELFTTHTRENAVRRETNMLYIGVFVAQNMSDCMTASAVRKSTAPVFFSAALP